MKGLLKYQLRSNLCAFPQCHAANNSMPRVSLDQVVKMAILKQV